MSPLRQPAAGNEIEHSKTARAVTSGSEHAELMHALTSGQYIAIHAAYYHAVTIRYAWNAGSTRVIIDAARINTKSYSMGSSSTKHNQNSV